MPRPPFDREPPRPRLMAPTKQGSREARSTYPEALDTEPYGPTNSLRLRPLGLLSHFLRDYCEVMAWPASCLELRGDHADMCRIRPAACWL